MTIRKTISAILMTLCVLCFTVLAQTTEKNATYQIGETLEYEGNYSKLILRGIDIAQVNFSVESVPNSENLVIKTEAKSQGGLSKFFNFQFFQSIESTIDGENLQVLRTAKRDEQGDRVRVSEALFDYDDKKVSYIESDPNNTASPPRVVASTVKMDTQDIVSAIYMLRYAPLAVGESFDIILSDSGLVYTVPVRVTAREERKSAVGKRWCFRVEPEIFGKNRLIEKDGELVIWITDDDERIPVRANISTDIGKIVIKIRSVTKATDAAASAK